MHPKIIAIIITAIIINLSIYYMLDLVLNVLLSSSHLILLK